MSSQEPDIAAILQLLAQNSLDSGNAGAVPTIGAALGDPSIGGGYKTDAGGGKNYDTGDLMAAGGNLVKLGDATNAMIGAMSPPQTPNAAPNLMPKNMEPADIQAYRGGSANTRLGLMSQYAPAKSHNQIAAELYQKQLDKLDASEPPDQIHRPLQPGEAYDPRTDIMISDSRPAQIGNQFGGVEGTPNDHTQISRTDGGFDNLASGARLFRPSESPQHAEWQAKRDNLLGVIMRPTAPGKQAHPTAAEFQDVTNIPKNTHEADANYQKDIAAGKQTHWFGGDTIPDEVMTTAGNRYNDNIRRNAATAQMISKIYGADALPPALTDNDFTTTGVPGNMTHKNLMIGGGAQQAPPGNTLAPSMPPQAPPVPNVNSLTTPKAVPPTPRSPEEAVALVHSNPAYAHIPDAQIIALFLKNHPQGQ